jgi:uncharacterized membrane protein
MSWYDWLLFLHVASVFVLGMAMIGFWGTIAIASHPFGGNPSDVATTVVRPANIIVGPAALATLVFGVWLALYVDGYALWDGWILTSILLWVVAVVAGTLSGRMLAGAMERPAVEAAAARRRGMLLHGLSSLTYIAILVLMIYKPGA